MFSTAQLRGPLAEGLACLCRASRSAVLFRVLPPPPLLLCHGHTSSRSLHLCMEYLQFLSGSSPKPPLPLGHVLAAGAARRRIWGHESREGSPLRIIAWTLMFNHLSSQLGAYLGMPSRGEPQLPPVAKLPAEHSLAQNAQRPSHIRRLDSDAPGWSNEPDSCAMMRAMRRLSHEAPRKPCVALKTAALSSTSSPREHEDLQRS